MNGKWKGFLFEPLLLLMCLLFNCTHSKCLLTQYTHVSVKRASHKRVSRSRAIESLSQLFGSGACQNQIKLIYLCSFSCYYGSVVFLFLDPKRPQTSWSLRASLPQAFLSVNWAGQQTLPGLPNKATSVNLREDRGKAQGSFLDDVPSPSPSQRIVARRWNGVILERN